ncbi:MAG: copper resistance protein B [Steroidobacter sp.]
MNLLVILSSAIPFVFSATVVQGAEDHSVHREHQDQQIEPSEEKQHEDHSAHETRTPQHDEHSLQPRGGHDGPTESELRHVPPPPPQHPMGDMSTERMIELMQMEDTAPVGMALIDQFEWREIDDADVILWDGQAWYGDDYNKAWFKAEGERLNGEYEGRTELLWDRIAARWWSVQAGVRHDFGEGPSRTWAAFGLQGLAPHWFEVEATIYVGDEGRIAARASVEYDLLLTQRLILRPELEFNAYGEDDSANGIGSGFSDGEIALRLRYEIRREVAPYLGVAWTRLYGDTADLARAAGRGEDDLQVVAGVRMWF